MSETLPIVERVGIAEVEPASLAAVRARVRATLPQASETFDRRGFRLLQWPPIRPNAAGKPIELSLEHEARLRADRPGAAGDLSRHFEGVEGRALFAGHPRVGDLVVRRVARAPGAQSVDRYWDTADGGFAAAMTSLRQRTRTSKFMTWAGEGGDDAAAVFNLELPLVALGDAGVVARLEFNWIDDLAATFAEFAAHRAGSSADPRNPLVFAHAPSTHRLDDALRPVVEHTTFREKYSLRRPDSTGQEAERFQLNVDHMMVQSLISGRFAPHCDVDVSAAVPVDEALLVELDTLATLLSDRFGLRPADAPKYWWDLRAVGR